jgi:hypothetical protein
MLMKKILHHLVKRGQIGQSLVVLALGFVALLAFVGIVTDVSLMFVRYSTLRRAVDAAAVAAAGKMRREPILDASWQADVQAAANGDPAAIERVSAQEQARNIATVGLAARQFIEFHGLDPKEVWVQTCHTEESNDPELCDVEEQRKLVRVTASVESPTVFLRLLGFPNIELQASAISETAVLDVIMIIDVSESMLVDTTYQDWANIGRGVVYLPPNITTLAADLGVQEGGPPDSMWYRLTNLTPFQVNDNIGYGNSTNTPTNYYARPIFDAYSGTQQEPVSEACRVRYYPFSVTNATPNAARNVFRGSRFDGQSFTQVYQSVTGQVWPGAPSAPRNYNGFVPTFDFYGCCNDPNNDAFTGGGDGFSDLICQPFKEARDATEEFLRQIDFTRGDRVGFVTFDQQAHTIDPDGTAGDSTHMIDNENDAIRTLRELVGVKAEPSAYQEDTVNGGWRRFAVEYDSYTTTAHNYPVYGNCPFQDALMFQDYVKAGTGPIAPLELAYFPTNPGGAYFSYQLWASCRGTNVGAALRHGSNALKNIQTTRSTGTVWVMVLLGDGAAGASDPARIGGRVANAANPYNNPLPIAGEYGAYGVCPYEELTGGYPRDLYFPFCSDVRPDTRHFCFDERFRDATTGEIYLELANPAYPDCGNPNSGNAYDVDDYARDWADFVGLAEEGASVDIQLPTIFTIGFGLNYDDCTPTSESDETDLEISRDIPDCLGEALLRYVADVGDNYRLDTDYQQDLKDNNSPDMSIAPGEWGPRDPCEDPTINPLAATNNSQLIAPLPPMQSCGNYFNAPTTKEELEVVFDEIASRMFTRLAR